ncbi:unnamed protein product [Sympodiomycopsis kandeliae]
MGTSWIASSGSEGQGGLSIVLSPWLVVVLLSLAAYYLLYVPPAKLHNNFNTVPVINSRFPGLGAVGFFANRYTWLSKNTTKDAERPHDGIYKFNLLGKVVYHVGSADEEVMRQVCLNRDLSFSGGNNFLFAGIQGAGQKGLQEGGVMDLEEKREMKAIAQAISPARLDKLRSVIVSDTLEALDTWPTLIDLQERYYPLIFRVTTRLMGMAEYASDPKKLTQLQKGFWHTQKNSGFWTTMFPWLPQPRLLLRLKGAVSLWYMVRSTVVERKKSGQRFEDFAQNLIDQDMGVDKISRWVIGSLLAGILNTIGTGAYTIAFIGADAKLRQQVKKEVIETIRQSALDRGDDLDSLSTHEAISKVSLDEWENKFTLLHLCFKESIRLLLTNSLNRYYPGPGKDAKGNLKPRLQIDGHFIEDDVYVTFSPPSNLHNARSFENPFKFDPTRYQRGEGQSDYQYIAWGAGHHKCTGMRFAKLETIVAIATLLFTLDDFQTTDEKGTPYSLENIPLPDLSQSHWRAPTRPMRVKITRKQPKE